jgi:hypothetical protein
MQEQDAWCILNTRIHNAMLARWQILKADARSRNYKGPTDNAEISKDPEKARSAWIEWIVSRDVHLDWLRVQMITLLNKETFHDLREIVKMIARARAIMMRRKLRTCAPFFCCLFAGGARTGCGAVWRRRGVTRQTSHLTSHKLQVTQPTSHVTQSNSSRWSLSLMLLFTMCDANTLRLLTTRCLTRTC